MEGNPGGNHERDGPAQQRLYLHPQRSNIVNFQKLPLLVPKEKKTNFLTFHPFLEHTRDLRIKVTSDWQWN